MSRRAVTESRHEDSAISVKHSNHDGWKLCRLDELPAEPTAPDLEAAFARRFPSYTKWVAPAMQRQIIQRALDDNECPFTLVAEMKERGELKPPARCATHYDRSLLIERTVGGYLCTVCDQYVCPRETGSVTRANRTPKEVKGHSNAITGKFIHSR